MNSMDKEYIEVRRYNEFSGFLFNYEPNGNTDVEYYNSTNMVQCRRKSEYNYTHTTPCTDIHITRDQWYRFINRLTLLSIGIRTVMKTINASKDYYYFESKNGSLFSFERINNREQVIGVKQYGYWTKTLFEGSDLEDDGIIELLPYNPELDALLIRYTTEIRDTMNEWLHFV